MSKLNKFLFVTLLGISFSCTNPTNNTSGTQTSTSSNNILNLKSIKEIPVGKVPHGMTASNGFVYNSDTGENTISIIDTKTDSVVKKITLDGKAGYLKAFMEHKYVSAFDNKLKKLHIIDPLQDHKIIQTVDLSGNPDKIRFSEDEKKAVVSYPNEEKFTLITFDNDLTKKAQTKDYDTGKVSKEEEHRAIEFYNNMVLLPNYSDNDVSLFDLNKNTSKRLKDGNTPTTVDLTDKKAIVGNKSSNTISIFELDSDKKTTLTEVGLTPTDSLLLPDQKMVFITMAGSNDVAVIDFENNKLLKRIPVGKRPVHIYLAPKVEGMAIKHDIDVSEPEVWVSNDDGDSISIINAKKMEVKATVAVGKGHHKMAFSGSKGYISNLKDNTISVIDRNQIK